LSMLVDRSGLQLIFSASLFNRKGVFPKILVEAVFLPFLPVLALSNKSLTSWATHRANSPF
jgi:hypothetical protein